MIIFHNVFNHCTGWAPSFDFFKSPIFKGMQGYLQRIRNKISIRQAVAQQDPYDLEQDLGLTPIPDADPQAG